MEMWTGTRLHCPIELVHCSSLERQKNESGYPHNRRQSNIKSLFSNILLTPAQHSVPWYHIQLWRNIPEHAGPPHVLETDNCAQAHCRTRAGNQNMDITSVGMLIPAHFGRMSMSILDKLGFSHWQCLIADAKSFRSFQYCSINDSR